MQRTCCLYNVLFYICVVFSIIHFSIRYVLNISSINRDQQMLVHTENYKHYVNLMTLRCRCIDVDSSTCHNIWVELSRNICIRRQITAAATMTPCGVAEIHWPWYDLDLDHNPNHDPNFKCDCDTSRRLGDIGSQTFSHVTLLWPWPWTHDLQNWISSSLASSTPNHVKHSSRKKFTVVPLCQSSLLFLAVLKHLFQHTAVSVWKKRHKFPYVKCNTVQCLMSANLHISH